jgi:hypothetical protein
MLIKTINLKGRPYAQVGDRVNAFNKAHKNGSIRTDLNVTGNTAVVKATVVPDVENEKRYFQGSALSVSLNEEKGLEKLETTAVGRALAMAGFATDGQIVTYEEMQRFEENNNENKTQTQNQAKSNIEVWLTEKQFQNLMQSDTPEVLKAVLESKKTKEGKSFGIKNEYRTQLQNKLNQLQNN